MSSFCDPDFCNVLIFGTIQAFRISRKSLFSARTAQSNPGLVSHFVPETGLFSTAVSH
jgi:hypothetical protein